MYLFYIEFSIIEFITVAFLFILPIMQTYFEICFNRQLYDFSNQNVFFVKSY